MDRTMIEQLQNADVYSESGDKIGSVGQVYLDDQSDEPTFVTVKTGLFGTNETFIPLDNARHTQDGITVPFEKDFVKDAPNVDADGNLTPEEEQRIYEYYSMDYSTMDDHRDGDLTGRDQHVGDRDARHDAGVAGTAGVAGVAGRRDDADTVGIEDRVGGERDAAAGERAAADGRTADRHDGDVTDGDSMVVRDEKLTVGTERRATGRMRLRKQQYTTTETVEVPVTREEVVVERHPVDPNAAQARAGGADGDIEVTTYEETPVVDKTVEAEEVSVGKRQVRDTETVSEELRHEDVEIDGDVDGDVDGRGRRGDRV